MMSYVNRKHMAEDAFCNTSDPTSNGGERDGQLTYYDELKYQEFTANKEKQFRNHNIINFDIIRNQCRGDKLNKSIREHKTVAEKDFKLSIRSRNQKQLVVAPG